MKREKYTYIGFGKYGYWLSCAIIIARALQSCSVPMTEWSVLSWCLMLMPIWWQYPICWVAWGLGKLIGFDRYKI